MQANRANVVYFGAPSISYPRNARIRNYLETSLGATVRLPDLDVDHSGISGKLRRLSSLFRGSKGATVIFVAEMATKYALPALLVARVRSATLIIDGFVGLHETHIEDWKQHSAHSPQAFLYRGLDWLAFVSADLYLIDTDLRAAQLRAKYRRNTPVLSLPVGAPPWAQSTPFRSASNGPVRLLYYGNYIPLHGVDVILRAMTDDRIIDDVHLTLVGDGKLRKSMEDLVVNLGLSNSTTFLDPVPEHELQDLISEHDVVLGIFGTSKKAQSVIANKVWQGLACGRLVVTQDSAALAEIPAENLQQLIEVPSGDSLALAAALHKAASRLRSGEKIDFPSARHTLDRYVASKFAQLNNYITIK